MSATPTHSTRTAQVWKTNDDDKLYLIIMLFNSAMTFITPLWNSAADNAEGIKKQSICSGLNMGEDMGMLPIYDMPGRRAVYSLFIISYTVVALLIVFPIFVKNHHDKHGCTYKLISPISAYLVLVVAGALYLGGDNILLLYRTYSNQTPFGPVNDVRSHVVAISLVLMIINKIIFRVGNSVYEHCSTRKDDGSIVFAELSTKKVDEVEDGTTKNKLQWDLFRNSNFVEKTDSTAKNNRPLQGGEMKQPHKNHHLNLSLHNPTCNESVNVGLSLSEELATSGTLQLIMANDKSRADLRKDLTLSHFEYSQPTEDRPYITSHENYVYMILIGFYKRMFSYAVIMDALYTTTLDEVTHQDAAQLEGCTCEKSATIVAYSLFALLTFFWVALVITLAGLVGCFSHKKEFNLVGCFSHKKEYKRLPSFLDTLSCAPCNSGNHRDCTSCWKSLFSRCCNKKKKRKDTNQNECKDTNKNTGIVADLSNCLATKIRKLVEYLIEKACWVEKGCFVVWAISCIFLFPLIIYLLEVVGVVFILIVVLLLFVVIALLFLLMFGVSCICYGRESFRKKNKFNIHCEGILDQDCERSAIYAAKALPHVAMVCISVAAILFLPLYLIQDNKFPWVCLIKDKDNGMGPWLAARYIFLIIVTITNAVVSFALKAENLLSEKNDDKRPAPTSNLMTMPLTKGRDSQPTPDNYEHDDLEISLDMMEPAPENQNQPAYEENNQFTSEDNDRPPSAQEYNQSAFKGNTQPLSVDQLQSVDQPETHTWTYANRNHVHA